MGTRQWHFVADMDKSGLTTISDVWLWIFWLYYYPGDLIIYFIINKLPAIAQFFEITARSYSSFLSGFFSGIVWLIMMAIVIRIILGIFFFKDNST